MFNISDIRKKRNLEVLWRDIKILSQNIFLYFIINTSNLRALKHVNQLYQGNNRPLYLVFFYWTLRGVAHSGIEMNFLSSQNAGFCSYILKFFGGACPRTPLAFSCLRRSNRACGSQFPLRNKKGSNIKYLDKSLHTWIIIKSSNIHVQGTCI